MAVVDAGYRFAAVDVGGYGRQSDGGTFGAWSLKHHIERGTLGLPQPTEVETGGAKLPYVFVADAAFPLHENIMTPFAGKRLTFAQHVFNYRLSRARRIVENAFGILAARWRIFRRTMEYQPNEVNHIILACVALHNFLCSRKESKSHYIPPHYADHGDTEENGDWRTGVMQQVLPSIYPCSVPDIPGCQSSRFQRHAS